MFSPTVYPSTPPLSSPPRSPLEAPNAPRRRARRENRPDKREMDACRRTLWFEKDDEGEGTEDIFRRTGGEGRRVGLGRPRDDPRLKKQESEVEESEKQVDQDKEKVIEDTDQENTDLVSRGEEVEDEEDQLLAQAVGDHAEGEQPRSEEPANDAAEEDTRTAA